MSLAVNGNTPHLTDGDDVRVRVRASGNPRTAPDPGVEPRKSAHARAISRWSLDRQAQRVRNFASQHAGEARESVRGSWAVTESPQPIADVARHVFPARGEAGGAAAWVGMSAAGAFRLAVFILGQLVQLAVATRLRAGVALALTVVAALAGVVMSLLGAH